MLTPHQGFTYNKFQKPNDWPKIEDTFDYKYDNGKLIGGNKNLFLSGPVTYEKVGNPVIKDGVVSGFSSSDYLSLPAIPNNNIEMVFNFKTPSSSSSVQQTIFFSYYNSNSETLGIRIMENGKIMLNVGVYGSVTYDTALALDTDYWMKCIITNTTASALISTDGVNYTTFGTINNLAITDTQFKDVHIGNWGGIRAFQGSIGLNNTYIKVNDNLWFYGKNYTTSNMVPVPAGLEYNNTTAPSNGWVYTNSDLVKGPVGYTVVGSPTIVDGVASGFSSSDYLRINNFQDSGSSLELNIEFTTPPSASNACLFYAGSFRAFFAYNGTRLNVVFNSSSSQETGYIDYTFDYGTKYTVNILRNGTTAFVKIYKGTTLEKEVEIPNISAFNNGNSTTMVMGYENIIFATPFIGSIDLNETYIKVNGKLWFGNVSRFQEFIPAPEEAQIGKDDTRNLTVETPIIKGQVGYTVVGSPTIVNGVASGFSANDYLKSSVNVPSTVQSDYKTNFEFQTRISLPQGYDVTRQLFYFPYRSGISGCRVTSTGVLEWYVYSDIVKLTAQLQTGTYWIKGVIQNNTVELFTKTDNTQWALADSASTGDIGAAVDTDRPVILGNNWDKNSAFPGSIDLNETYIKVNGQYWFKPKTELLSPKMVGPVNYTVVGSPTIVDGIASGFFSGNYLQISQTYNATNNKNVEIYVRAKMPTTFSSSFNPILTSENVGYWTISSYTNALFTIRMGYSNGTGLTFNDMYIRGGIQPDTWYRFKITGNNGIWRAEIYSDSGTLLNSSDKDWTSKTVSANYTLYIQCTDSTRTYSGSIDLNETYIKVNNSLWFGKEDWTPSTYTDNAIYLLGSHSSDYSTYNTQGINPTIETESDESGTYNVWIDNQKIYKEQSNPLDINWNNLALTTGYDIITPSTLKAHVIKVEPNNGNITRFSTDTNYKVENGLLTWASPKLYLEGPTQYTVVGNPTIVDGVASGFSGNDNLQIRNGFPLNTAYEMVVGFSVSDLTGGGNLCTFQATNNITYGLHINAYAALSFYSPVGTFLNSDAGAILTNKNYKAKYIMDGVNQSLYLDEGNGYVLQETSSVRSSEHSINYFDLGGGGTALSGSIDLNSTYIKVNNELWFGKIYTSETDVPVPANFTYGNTTTSSNGTVNLITQEFSADTLATYGKDS